MGGPWHSKTGPTPVIPLTREYGLVALPHGWRKIMLWAAFIASVLIVSVYATAYLSPCRWYIP